MDSRAALLKGGANGAALSPGKSAASLLLARVTGEKAPRMPMGSGPLPEAEIAALRKWIDSGALDASAAGPQWEAKLALTGPAVSIDAAVAAYRKKAGLTGQAGRVTDSAYARRVYLDVLGLPPSPGQLDAFLADRSADKRKALVALLLKDRKRFSENWVSFWNDLLHNDEGVTYIGDRKSITPWLLASLEGNKHYDDMVRELIDPPAGKGSEGFIVGVNWRGDVNASQLPVMQAAQNSSQVFLGVNLKCNSCHDSFISKWKLKDAYGMASFFSEKPLELVRCDAKTGVMSSPTFLYPELGTVAADATLAERRRVAASLFTSKANGRLPRTLVNRVWQRLMGRGLVEPADEMDAEPWSVEVLDGLSYDFVQHGYDVDWLLTAILTSDAYQMPSVIVPDAEKKYVFRGPLQRRITAEQFVDSVSAITGEWRVLTTTRAGAGVYGRDWRFKPSSLSSALGRPARDLAVTERFNDPTTLQMLELVNGNTLANILRDGAMRMLGTLGPPPAPLFDSGVVSSGPSNMDIDLTGKDTLILLVVDHDSYDPSRVKTGWVDAAFEGPGGAKVALSDLVKPETRGTLRVKDATADSPAVLATLPTRLVLDLKGKGFTRLKGRVASDAGTLSSDIAPKVRYFAFGDEPQMKALPGVKGDTPVAVEPAESDAGKLVTRVFRHALSREPNPKEHQIAVKMLGNGADRTAGLEDLLWSLVLSPEFQYLR